MNTIENRTLYLGIKAKLMGDFLLNAPLVIHSNGFQVSIFIEDGVFKISLIKAVSNYEVLPVG